jgi:hypothetical protein
MDLYAGLAQTWPPEWVRGPRVRHERGWLVLEPEGSESYQPGFESGLAYELTGVSDPDDAIAFVRRWGLLRHGAFTDSKPLREPFEEWLATVTAFRYTLLLYDLLMRSLAGDEEALDELEGTWGEVVRGAFNEPSTDRAGLLVQVSELIAGMVTKGMQSSSVRLDSATLVDDDPGTFVIGTTSPDLVGFAYNELATIINGRTPIERCEMCGRFFEVVDARQRHCSKACAGRARSRRFRRKRAEAKA